MFENLIQWSLDQHYKLPWRKKRSLYTTLVSEIMLQQTTVSTVLNHYERFLKQFPNLKALAQSSEEEMQIAWKGLGYYRRAKNLRQAAIDLVEIYQGKFPEDKESLMSISGIGEYTASALLAIGKDEQYLAIDANLERVLSRIYGIDEIKGPKLHKKIQELFAKGKIIKQRDRYSFRDLNEALMDLGRVYCRANKVQCDLCPMAKNCKALKTKSALTFPMQPEKKKAKYYDLQLVKFVVKSRKKILGKERKANEWLTGQIELPTYVVHSEDKSLKQYPYLRKKLDVSSLPKLKSAITKYRITNYIYELSKSDMEKIIGRDHGLKNFDQSHTNFTTTALKCLKLVEK